MGWFPKCDPCNYGVPHNQFKGSSVGQNDFPKMSFFFCANGAKATMGQAVGAVT